MKIKTKLLFLAAFLVVAVPLVFAGDAGAGLLPFPWVHSDGASLNSNGGWQLDDPGFCNENSAVKNRQTCTTTVNPNITNSTDCGTYKCTDDVSADSATCNAAGYSWIRRGSWNTTATACYGTWAFVNFYTWTGNCYEPGTTDPSVPTYTAMTACTTAGKDWQPTNVSYPNGHESMGGDRMNCLRCHSDAYMYGRTSYGVNGPNKDRYLLTGHKNMLRKVDGGTAGRNLGGPGYTSTNSTVKDKDGNDFFADVLTSVPGGAAYTTLTDTNIYYIYGGWYRNVKEAQIKRLTATAPAPSKVNTSPSTYNAASTSCASCHSTGYMIAQQGTFPMKNVNGTGNSWYYEGVQCSRCHKGQPHYSDFFADGHAAHAEAAMYEDATDLCFQCHEQATTYPYQVMVSPSATNHTLYSNFTGHYRTNMFLNSPHGRFSGTNHAAVAVSENYDSHFLAKTYCSDNQYMNITDCTNSGSTWGGTCSDPTKLSAAVCTSPAVWTASAPIGSTHNAGCMECHDVHISSVDPDVLDPVNTLSNIKTEGMCGVSCHTSKANFGTMNHPSGPNTPMDGNLASDKGKMMACVTCHMGPGTVHLFRINTGAGYSPFVSGSNIAATYDDDGYQGAAMSVDLACGQCHGGSAGPTFTKNSAPYFDKAALAGYAVNMHNSHPTANFSSSPDSSTPYKVNFSAASSICPPAHTCSYSWDFGGLGTDTGIATSYTFGSSASVAVTLTVTTNAYTTGSITKTVTPSTVNQAPTCGNSAITASVMTASFTDTSSDPENAAALYVNWGDGSPVQAFSLLSAASHTYAYKGTYSVKRYVRDTGGQVSQCNPVSVTVGSTVGSMGTLTVSPTGTGSFNMSVYVKKDGLTKAFASVAVNGTKNFNLSAGTYKLYFYYPSGKSCVYTNGVDEVLTTSGLTVAPNSCQ